MGIQWDCVGLERGGRQRDFVRPVSAQYCYSTLVTTRLQD
jgi:hypothetical protein